jgi:hypothetical protein
VETKGYSGKLFANGDHKGGLMSPMKVVIQ